MDTQNFINFKKKRDLGAILSDTFKFLYTEWKTFFGTILKISIIPILIAICAVIYYGMSSVSLLGDFSQIADLQGSFNFSDFLLPLLAFFFLILSCLCIDNSFSAGLH